MFVSSWFQTAYEHGVELVLNGHDHDYERFARQDPSGQAAVDGVEQIVVGTGGAAPRAFESVQPNSLVRFVDRGILVLDLWENDTYSYAFLDDMTGSVDDAGSGACHP